MYLDNFNVFKLIKGIRKRCPLQKRYHRALNETFLADYLVISYNSKLSITQWVIKGVFFLQTFYSHKLGVCIQRLINVNEAKEVCVYSVCASWESHASARLGWNLGLTENLTFFTEWVYIGGPYLNPCPLSLKDRPWRLCCCRCPLAAVIPYHLAICCSFAPYSIK